MTSGLFKRKFCWAGRAFRETHLERIDADQYPERAAQLDLLIRIALADIRPHEPLARFKRLLFRANREPSSLLSQDRARFSTERSFWLLSSSC